MSISTGDSRHSTPKKSTTPAAAGGPDTEGVDTPADGPVGGVLPVKPVRKATRSTSTTGGAGRTTTDGSSRTGSGSAARTGGNSAGAGTTGGTGTARAKSTPAKSAGTKAATAKATSKATTSSRQTSVTEEIEGGLFSSNSSTKPAAKATKAKAPAALSGGKGTKGRRPVAPVKVAQTRNWGPIALYVATGLAAVLIIGYGVWPVIGDSFKPGWREQATSIEGIRNYLDSESEYFNAALASGNHQAGLLTYPMTPPVGGTHNARWQNCMGDVYASEIAEEHAVHALEHGAVWITYRPDLPQEQIDELAEKVRDVEYTLMSPFPDLDAPISVQAWGYQLKVDNAEDGRIDDFVTALRRNATQEDGASCSGGITDANPTPFDLGGMEQ